MKTLPGAGPPHGSTRVVGVLLAGGRSSRMGTPKALLRDGSGRTWLEAGVQGARQAGARLVVVVTGCRPAPIAREALRWSAIPIHNRRFSRGQWSSVRVGLRAAVDRGADRIVLGPIDVPAVRPDTIARLIGSRSAWAVPLYRGARGHPVSLSSAVARELLRLRGAANLREALQACGETPEEIEVDDPEILAVLNTPQQYRRWVSLRAGLPAERPSGNRTR